MLYTKTLSSSLSKYAGYGLLALSAVLGGLNIRQYHTANSAPDIEVASENRRYLIRSSRDVVSIRYIGSTGIIEKLTMIGLAAGGKRTSQELFDPNTFEEAASEEVSYLNLIGQISYEDKRVLESLVYMYKSEKDPEKKRLISKVFDRAVNIAKYGRLINAREPIERRFIANDESQYEMFSLPSSRELNFKSKKR